MVPLLMFGAVAGLFALPTTCSSTEGLTADPIAKLIEQYDSKNHFTILLYDMESTGILRKAYQQRYRVLYDSSGQVGYKDSPWYKVSAAYYRQHENNIGVEVAAKSYDDQKVRRVVGPPGYTNYIGNPQYGFWYQGMPVQLVYTEYIPAAYRDSTAGDLPLVSDSSSSAPSTSITVSP